MKKVQIVDEPIGDPGEIENRQEQFRAIGILRKHSDHPEKFDTEYEMHDLKPVQGEKCPYCCPDIVDLQDKIVYRLMGPIHEKRHRKLKDEIQKFVLEGNGWIVKDMWYKSMPNLFAQKRTDEKNRQAELEVLKFI